MNHEEKKINKELLWTASSHNRILYFQKMIEILYKTVKSNIILDLYNSYWDCFLNNMKLNDWVLNTLETLKAKWFKIAVVSNLITNIQLKKLSKLGIEAYIDILVTSEEAWIEKPASTIFYMTLKKLDVLLSDSIMVWDSIVNDIEWWRNIWLKTGLFINDEKKVDTSKYNKSDYIINNIWELLEIL